jgi:hypothetical protein
MAYYRHRSVKLQTPNKLQYLLVFGPLCYKLSDGHLQYAWGRVGQPTSAARFTFREVGIKVVQMKLTTETCTAKGSRLSVKRF